jgi:hypothetical protein
MTQRVEEDAIRTNALCDQLRLDLEQLDTSITANEGARSGDNIVGLSMESRSTWRDQQATISRNLIEIDGIAKLHNLTDIQDRITETRSKITTLSNRIELVISNIKTNPIKLPPHPRDANEDLINLEDAPQTAATDNRTPRRDHPEGTGEGLTNEATAKRPLTSMIDAEKAWPRPREALDNPHTNIYCRSPGIGHTPGLTDRLMQTDPARAATWFLDYGDTAELLHSGGRGPKPEAAAVSAHRLGDYSAIKHIPPVPLDVDAPTHLVDLTITEDDDLV